MSRQLGARKTRNYSPSKLENAVKMVESGAMSRKKAAATFGVPRTTLIDKLSGRYCLGACPGRKTVLTKSEEGCLVDYCKLMGSIGYPLKKNDLLVEVKKVLDHDGRTTPFNNNMPGKDWYYGFMRRHPELAERTAMALGHQRALITQSMIDTWFLGLQSYLKKEVPGWEEMLKDPRRSFNADESGFPLCVNTGKVLAEKGARHVYQVTSSTKQQITVMVCFNAMGQYVPPLIVFPGERFRDSGIHEFPEAIYGQTVNGWMDSELFVEFLKHLDAYIKEHSIPKPVILYVDGHSTHMSLEASAFCNNNGIILYCLLPNATHILQPCDVGFFGPMKSTWRKMVKDWHIENIGQSFTKKQFPAVFKKAWLKVAKIENAIHGFHRCGLFPMCPKNIDVSKLNPSKLHETEPSMSSENNNEHSNMSVSVYSLETSSSVDDKLHRPVLSIPVPSVSDTISINSHLPVVTTGVDSLPIATTEADSLPMATTGADSFPVLYVTTGEESLPVVTTGVETLPVVTTPAERLPVADSILSPVHVSASTSSLATPEISGTLPKKCALEQPSTSSNFIHRRSTENFVSPSFSLLSVPEIRKKKQTATTRQKLPKALSGMDALKMLKERLDKKKADKEAKIRRKEEREQKRKQKEEEKLRKKQEREEIKKTRSLEKRAKQSKKRKVVYSSSESELGSEVAYADSDDEFDEKKLCPGCQTDDGTSNEWIFCSNCPRKWHITCTGEELLLDIPENQIKAFPYMCEYCKN